MNENERKLTRTKEDSLSHYRVPQDFFTSFQAEVMHQIDTLDEKVPLSRRKKVRFLPFYFAAAASIVVAVVSFFLLEKTSHLEKPQDTFAFSHSSPSEDVQLQETTDWDLYMNAATAEQSEEYWLQTIYGE